MLLNPSPTDQLAGFADLAMGEGAGERANGKANSIRERCALIPGPAKHAGRSITARASGS